MLKELYMGDWDYLIRLIITAEYDVRNLLKPIWKSSDEHMRKENKVENNKGNESYIWKSD